MVARRRRLSTLPARVVEGACVAVAMAAPVGAGGQAAAQRVDWARRWGAAGTRSGHSCVANLPRGRRCEIRRLSHRRPTKRWRWSTGESQQTGRQGSGRKLWCWHESISVLANECLRPVCAHGVCEKWLLCGVFNSTTGTAERFCVCRIARHWSSCESPARRVTERHFGFIGSSSCVAL